MLWYMHTIAAAWEATVTTLHRDGGWREGAKRQWGRRDLCFSFEEARALKHGKLQQCFSIIFITQKQTRNGPWVKRKKYIRIKLGDILIAVHEINSMAKNKSVNEAELHININITVPVFTNTSISFGTLLAL